MDPLGVTQVTRLIILVFLVLELTACQSMPATESAVSPAETALLRETPVPSPALTRVPTSVLLPTPTISPAELTRRAGPVCENAFSAPVETGPLTPPFAVIKKATYNDAPVWEPLHQLPHLGSLAASDVRTVFCIIETRAETGTYTDGSAAYQHFWEVRAIAWPGGRVVGKHSFTGSAPPKTQATASDSAEGSFPSPYGEFAAWVFHEVDHPDFIHFTHAVTTIAVSPDGDLVAFGTARANELIDREYQAKIFLLQTSDMQIISAVDGHQGLVTSLAFSPDGEMLASSGYDLFVKFWDVASNRLLGQVHIADMPNSITFSPDGMNLAVASNLKVAFIDVTTMRVERSLQEASGKDLTYSPDGGQVYVNALGRIKMIDTSANLVMLTFPDPFALIPTLSVAADGSVVGVTYESPDRVDGFALSPGGAQIMSYTIDRSQARGGGAENIRLAAWDAKTGKYVDEIRFSGDDIRTIQFSPDGTLLAVGTNNEIWIWDANSWQFREKLTGHIGFIADLEFSPDGRRILSAGSDGTIRLWNLKD